MEDNSLQNLLDLAESGIEIGIPIDCIRVCSAGSNYHDSALILDNILDPLDASVWKSFHHQTESLLGIKYQENYSIDPLVPTQCNETPLGHIPVCETVRDVISPNISNTSSDTQYSPAVCDFETENISIDNPDDSPHKDFSPKNLFHEDWDASTTHNSKTTNYVLDNIQEVHTSDSYTNTTLIHAFLTNLQHRTTVYNNSSNNTHYNLNNFQFHGEAVYYWITQTYRVKDNFALCAALQLSIELNVPMIALVSIILYCTVCSIDYTLYTPAVLPALCVTSQSYCILINCSYDYLIYDHYTTTYYYCRPQ